MPPIPPAAKFHEPSPLQHAIFNEPTDSVLPTISVDPPSSIVATSLSAMSSSSHSSSTTLEPDDVPSSTTSPDDDSTTVAYLLLFLCKGVDLQMSDLENLSAVQFASLETFWIDQEQPPQDSMHSSTSFLNLEGVDIGSRHPNS
ncbi:hypothetical protein V6N12_031441 [Hibiscus sabdariffa]|uniref:Uncharacterized protein n=1 Tax=Hibiscus sabdariffa TaxID=183260 RepID=A0ABR1ZJW4_9ROSI